MNIIKEDLLWAFELVGLSIFVAVDLLYVGPFGNNVLNETCGP